MGVGSPVSIDSSTQELPSLTTPSVGPVSPGRTCTRSPTSTSDTGISTGWPSRSTRAVGGCSCSSLRMASEVWPRARASSKRPSSTSVRITAADSKYTSAGRPSAINTWGNRVVNSEVSQAMPVPAATRVFMSAECCRKAEMAPVKKSRPHQNSTGVVRSSWVQALVNQGGRKEWCPPPSMWGRLESITSAVSRAATLTLRRSRVRSRASSRSMPSASPAVPWTWQQEGLGEELLIGGVGTRGRRMVKEKSSAYGGFLALEGLVPRSSSAAR